VSGFGFPRLDRWAGEVFAGKPGLELRWNDHDSMAGGTHLSDRRRMDYRSFGAVDRLAVLSAGVQLSSPTAKLPVWIYPDHSDCVDWI
jgi:hypothetical protein